MKRGKPISRWRLGDVVDLENLRDRLPLWKSAWKGGVRDQVEKQKLSTEKERRRVGFLLMLNEVREKEATDAGRQIMTGAHLVEVGVSVLMFLLGVGLVRGMLTGYVYHDDVLQTVSARGFNVWVFLALTLGVQWLVLLSALIGYLFLGRLSGSLSLLQGALGGLIKKCSGLGGKSRGARLEKLEWLKWLGASGGSLWGWRLTRILQSGGVGYNLGLLAGLFGCLWFLNVGFYWETSLPQFGSQSLQRVTQVLSAPVGGDLVSAYEVEKTNLEYRPSIEDRNNDMIHSMPSRMRADLAWSFFFFFALSVWGLLPRFLLWLGAWSMERRVLAGLDFQDAHHRSLWREVSRVDRGEVTTAPADGVVVLDIGGLEVKIESVRPYLLQVLRVNPEARFSLGTLDADGERNALEAARESALGVVFLVEGWNLSPKQMAIYHKKVRLAIGADHMIRYLVLDANDEEIQQWTSFVDELKDTESEVFRYSG